MINFNNFNHTKDIMYYKHISGCTFLYVNKGTKEEVILDALTKLDILDECKQYDCVNIVLRSTGIPMVYRIGRYSRLGFSTGFGLIDGKHFKNVFDGHTEHFISDIYEINASEFKPVYRPIEYTYD